jgi:tRNA dimethylallyltransferase
VWSAGDYARRARPLLSRIAAESRVPIVVGGTGFYLRALLDGLFDGPGRDDGLRRRLSEREQRRPGSLHRILSRIDPVSAGRIHSADVSKLIRALEVCLLTRRPLSEVFRDGRTPLTGFRWLKIGLDPPREQLYRRLDERAARMFESGLVEEVAGILHLGYPAGSKALDSLGYRQALRVLRGEITQQEAIELTQRETRRYAKRQRTWFRREPDLVWVRGFGDAPSAQLNALAQVNGFLATFSASA